MSKGMKRLYEFGPFRLDAGERTLLRDGEPVALPPKDVEMLLVLVENVGRLLEKDELMRLVWSDSFVEEANLSHHVFTLRKALGDEKGESKYIETVPRRGYRFVARVREVPEEGAGAAVEAHRLAQRAAVTSRRLIAGAVVMVVAVSVAGYFLLTSRRGQARIAAVRTIAVLPFKPLAADNRNESLELGMADTLIFRLSGIRGLVVRPISAVRKYAALNQDPLAAGREQQVDAVLDSNIQIAGEKVRVTARLVRVEDGLVVWADKSDEQFTDLFAAQDAIAERLAGSLVLKLTDEEKGRLTRRYTDNAEAYQLYLKGRYFFNRTSEDGLTTGIQYFQHAIEKDQTYALAYAGLADCYASQAWWQILPANKSLPQAKAAAEKALQIDDSLVEAHTSLGRVKSLSGDWSGAETEFMRAIARNPNDASAHHWHTLNLTAIGRLDDAMTEIRRAQQLDPLSLSINTDVGRVFYLSRRYGEAIAEYKKTLAMDPGFRAAHIQLGWAYEQQGKYDEVIAEYRKVMVLGGRSTLISMIGRAYALSGRKREARRILDELKELSKHSYVSPYYFAVIHAGLGDKETAIALLEKAYEEGGGQSYALNVSPMWDSIRSEPRFQDLLRRMGLTP